MNKTIKVGQKIPSFEAETQLGSMSDKDFQNRITVLYFYPKDNTPGCTCEAQDFRDYYSQFQKLGVQIIGLSKDTTKTHMNFAQKHELPFPLIADPEKTICEQFGVMKEKNMYGKKVWGIERSTFLIDSQGKIIKEWRGVKVPGHVEEVLATIKTIVES